METKLSLRKSLTILIDADSFAHINQAWTGSFTQLKSSWFYHCLPSLALLVDGMTLNRSLWKRDQLRF